MGFLVHHDDVNVSEPDEHFNRIFEVTATPSVRVRPDPPVSAIGSQGLSFPKEVTVNLRKRTAHIKTCWHFVFDK